MRGSVSRRGRKWRARIDLPAREGEPRRQESRTFESRRAAESWLARMEIENEGGLRADGRHLTLGDFLDMWLEAVQSSLKPNTVRHYRMACRRWKAVLRDAPLGQLAPLQVQVALNRMAAKLAPITARRTLTVLRTALRQGVAWQLLLADVVAGVRGPRGSREMACWNEVQAAAFLRAVRDATRYEPVFRLALASGMRLGELLGLRWEDVDWEGNAVHVRRNLSWPRGGEPQLVEPKSTASRRVIALDASTMEALRRQRRLQAEERLAAGPEWRGLGLVFMTTGGQYIDQRRIERLMSPLTSRAGVPRIRFHDLRHTHATILLRQGRSVKEVSQRLGHSGVAITLQTYAHVLPDQHLEAADVIGRVLDGQRSS